MEDGDDDDDNVRNQEVFHYLMSQLSPLSNSTSSASKLNQEADPFSLSLLLLLYFVLIIFLLNKFNSFMTNLIISPLPNYFSMEKVRVLFLNINLYN